MKRTKFVILATLSLAATSVVAQSTPTIKVNVPFNFMAGDKTLPAGEYTVQLDRTHVVAIHSTNFKSIATLTAHSAENTKMDGVPALKFNRYGDRYFLSQVWTGSTLGQEVQTSRAEREQIAAVPAHQGTVTLAAER